MEANWKSEQIVHSGDEYFDGLIEDLRNASRTIDLEVYIFDPDEMGKTIARELIAAAARGVRVRVLVDGFGAISWLTTYAPVLELNEVSTRVYHPMRFLWRLNRRNHRKACIVDARAAWVGSFNISAVHSARLRGSKAWRDCAVRVEGSSVQIISLLFQNTWRESMSPFSNPIWRIHWLLFWRRSLRRYFVTRQRYRAVRVRRRQKWMRLAEGLPLPHIRANADRKAGRRMALEFASRISNAEKRVWIANAYFVPTRLIRSALRRASQRGVDVRVMVPKTPDLIFIRWVSAAVSYSLVKCGVRMFEFLPSVMHAKYAIIDDWATVGSTNLNHRSFLYDLELDVVLSRQESIESLETHYEEDLKNARELGTDPLEHVSLIERVLGRILFRFRRWM